MREETKLWLDKAKDDLKKAKDNFNIGNYDLTSYLCQQSVEKVLKSYLIEKTGKFPKVHDLVRLGKLTGVNEDLLKDCERLTFVYTETRYPDVIQKREYTKEESEEDIKITEKIIKWVEQKL